MKASVYDYNNVAKIVDLPEIDSILSISVDIITGDEVVTFKIKDGAPIRVDACNCKRLATYRDYSYIVEGKDDIRRWLNYVPPRNCICVAYDRHYKFYDYD